MRVKAKDLGKPYSGYYNLVRRKPGAVFDLRDPKDFSDRWMERVEPATPKTAAPGEPLPGELPSAPAEPSAATVAKAGKKAAAPAPTESAGSTPGTAAPTGNAQVL